MYIFIYISIYLVDKYSIKLFKSSHFNSEAGEMNLRGNENVACHEVVVFLNVLLFIQRDPLGRKMFTVQFSHLCHTQSAADASVFARTKTDGC